MTKDTYFVKRVRIVDKWSDLDIFNEQNNIFIRVQFYDDKSVHKIDVSKFGWLQNYIAKEEFISEYNSNDIIGTDIYAIFNKNQDIECFGKNKNSARMKDILNPNYQNGSEQSKMTP